MTQKLWKLLIDDHTLYPHSNSYISVTCFRIIFFLKPSSMNFTMSQVIEDDTKLEISKYFDYLTRCLSLNHKK